MERHSDMKEARKGLITETIRTTEQDRVNSSNLLIFILKRVQERKLATITGVTGVTRVTEICNN